MKFCTKCGTQLDDSAVFCINCGNKMDTAFAQPQPQPQPQPQVVPSQSPAQSPFTQQYIPPVAPKYSAQQPVQEIKVAPIQPVYTPPVPTQLNAPTNTGSLTMGIVFLAVGILGFLIYLAANFMIGAAISAVGLIGAVIATKSKKLFNSTGKTLYIISLVCLVIFLLTLAYAAILDMSLGYDELVEASMEYKSEHGFVDAMDYHEKLKFASDFGKMLGV